MKFNDTVISLHNPYLRTRLIKMMSPSDINRDRNDSARLNAQVPGGI
ncbi:MAG: hypothetical protein FWG25_02585 [Promicromonosporaceae bacterium]|nr:hypothetical protein [Promicromonosporaceae bacterium]